MSAVGLTAPGTVVGKISITSTFGFKVKMRVLLADPVFPDLFLEVKRVNSSKELELGPLNEPIQNRTDLSAYGATSTLRATIQNRNTIPLQEIERAVYEEEPTIAIRNILVNEFGDKINESNPLFMDFNEVLQAASRKQAQLYNLINTGKVLTDLDLLIDERCQYITLNSGQLIYTS